MHSNIEQAVAAVVASKQDVDLTNVLSAYLRVAGFIEQSKDALTAFERALDKYPNSGNKADSVSAKFITDLRRSYWDWLFGGYGAGGEYVACPCCGVMTLASPPVCDPIEWDRAIPLADTSPAKAKKLKRRRIKKKRFIHKSKPLAFDPYGPSTSALSM